VEGGPDRRLAITCYPNPAVSYVTITLAGARRETPIEIYDVLGRLVRRCTSGREGAVWDLTDSHNRRVASGIYFVTAAAPGGAVKQKLILSR